MSCPSPASLASSATCSPDQFWCIDTFAETTMEDRLEEIPEDRPGSPQLSREHHQGQEQQQQQPPNPDPPSRQGGFREHLAACSGAWSSFPCSVRPQVPHQLQPLHTGDDDLSIDDPDEDTRLSRPAGQQQQRQRRHRGEQVLQLRPQTLPADTEHEKVHQLGKKPSQQQHQEEEQQQREQQEQQQLAKQPQSSSSLLQEASMLRLETQLARSEAKSMDLERRFEELEKELLLRRKEEHERTKSHEEEVQTLREQIDKLEARCEALVEDKQESNDLRDSAVREACEASRALGLAFEDAMARRFREFRDEISKLVEDLDDQQGSSGDRLYALEWALARNGIVLDGVPGNPEEQALKEEEAELEKWKSDQEQQKSEDLELDRCFQQRLREELSKLESFGPKTRKMAGMDSRKSFDGSSDLIAMTEAAQAAAAAAAAAVAAAVRAARGEQTTSPKAPAVEEKGCEFFSMCPEADETTLAMATTMTTLSTQAQTLTNVAADTEVSRVKALVQEHEHQFEGIADSIQDLRDDIAELSRNSLDRCDTLEQQSYEMKIDLARLTNLSERSLDARELAKTLEGRVSEQGHVILKIASRVDDAQARWISAERSYVSQEAYHADKKDTLETLVDLKASLKSVQRELQQAVASATASSSSFMHADDLRKSVLRDFRAELAQTMGSDHLVQQERRQTVEGLQTIQQQLDVLRRSVLFVEKDDHGNIGHGPAYVRESKERRTQSHPPSLRGFQGSPESEWQQPLLPLRQRSTFVERKAQDSISLIVDGTPSTAAGSLHKALSGSPGSLQVSPAPRSMSCPEATDKCGGDQTPCGNGKGNSGDSSNKSSKNMGKKSSASSNRRSRGEEEESSKSKSGNSSGEEGEESSKSRNRRRSRTSNNKSKSSKSNKNKSSDEKEDQKEDDDEKDERDDTDGSESGQPLAAKVRKLTGTILATESAIDALASKLLGGDLGQKQQQDGLADPGRQEDGPAASCSSRMRPTSTHAEDMESVKSSLRTMAECVGAAQGAVGALVPRLRGQNEVRFEEFAMESRNSGRKGARGSNSSLVKEVGAASLLMKEDLENTPASRVSHCSQPTVMSPPTGRREVRCDACWPWLISDHRR